MDKYVKFAICLLLAGSAQAVTTTWVPAGAGDWTTAANWNTGNVPTAGDDTRITVGSVAQVTLNGAGAAHRLIMENGSGLTIGASGNLVLGAEQTLIGNGAAAPTTSITVDGGVLTGGGNFGLGIAAGSFTALILNSGTVNANGGWLAAGYGGSGDVFVNGGTLNTSAGTPFYVGLNNGSTGGLTVTDGQLVLGSHLIVGSAAGSTGDVVINGGVTTTIALNFGGAGTQSLDLNGGQLITTGGFAEGANSTFYIGSGELVFNGGQTLAEVQTLVSGSNWIFDDTASVVDSGSGIVVTSIPEPATMGLLVLFGGALLGARRRRLFNR